MSDHPGEDRVPQQNETGQDVAVVLPAAGGGRRMGGVRKATMELLGAPLLAHSLRPFLEDPEVGQIVVSLHPEEAERPPPWLAALGPRVRCVAGGSTRGASVREALLALDPVPPVVVVHDAARPLTDRATFQRCVAEARSGRGGVAGWPSVDTLKEVDGERTILSTPDRSRIWQAHTPQAFPGNTVVGAYRDAGPEELGSTDDAALVSARTGLRIRMVEGSPWNIKVTHPEDVPMAEALLRLREGG